MDTDEYARWQQASTEAARGADLQAVAGLYHWAAFQYEQAARLALKGLLHGIGRGPDAWGHDVNRLGRAVSRALDVPLDDPLAAGMKRLARHYIPARYPDAVPGEAPSAYYSKQDAQSAQEDFSTVRDAVQTWWAALLDEREPRGEAGQCRGEEKP